MRLGNSVVAASLALWVAGCGGEGGGGDGDDAPPAADMGGGGGAGGQGGGGGSPPDAGGDGATGGSPGDAGADVGPAPDGMVTCQCTGRQTCEAGRCVEPADCVSQADCLSPRQCVGGACADPCAGDGDCDAGERCDAATLACVPGARCARDEDCAAGGGVCEDGGCAPRCAPDGCAGDQVCDPGTGRCREPDVCDGDDDCAGGRVCRDGDCVAECAEDAACPGAQRCVDGRCAEPDICNQDEDCTGQRICSAGACADRCPSSPCPGDLRCDDGTGRCVEASPCEDDAGCHPGRFCLDGACAAPCAEDAACPGNQRCDGGRCVSAAFCNGDIDCAGNTVCARGECVTHCDDAPCGGALMCDRASGLCREAAPCADDAGCLEGRRCVDGACADPCREDAACPGAQRCVDGVCAAPEFCGADADCGADGRCRDGACVPACDAQDRCAGGRRCVDGACLPGEGCAVDGDCRDGRVCHPETRICVLRCPAGDCPLGFVCGDDGLCAEPRPCAADDSCQGDRRCRLGLCRPSEGCEVRGDCAGGETCVDFVCGADPSCLCPDGFACADGVCRQPGPCGPDTCPAPWHCADDGRCAACLEDADCGGARACVDGACADPEVCDADADCLPGRVCFPGGRCGAPIGGCDDDAAAPNGGPLSAPPLPAGVHGGLRVCEGTDDWFTVQGDGPVRVVLRVAADRPVPALALYANEAVLGEPVDVGVPVPGETWVAAPPGTWFVRVTALPGGAGPYALEVEPGPACVDDRYARPWLNDSPGNAAVVGEGVIRGMPCGGNLEYFRFAEARPMRVEVEGARATVGGQDAPAEVQGPFVVAVRGSVGVPYTLRLTAPAVSPRERCAAAEALTLGEATDATVAPGGNDFAPGCAMQAGPERVFRFDLPRDATIEARFLSPSAGAGLLLYRDCAEAPAACSALAGTVRHAAAAGRWYLVVDGAYEGQIRVDAELPPEVCEEAEEIGAGAEPVVPTMGPSELPGGCVDVAEGEAVRTFTLAQRSRVRIAVDADGGLARVAVRGRCDDGASEVACAEGADVEFDRVLAAGTYTAIFQGPGPMVATFEATPAAAEAAFSDACDGDAVDLARGGALEVRGDTNLATDGYDASACGVGFGASDVVLRFRLAAPARVTATLADAAFGAVAILAPADCGAPAACPDAVDATRVEGDLAAGTWALVVDGRGLAQSGAFTATLEAR